MTTMKAEYIEHVGSDLSVVNAARVSFDKRSETLSEKDERLIRYLANHGHWTPFAHPHVTFRLKAPIFVARQLGKHQVGMVWSEVSRRYVDSDPEFFTPDVWRKRAENVKQGSSEEKAVLSKYWAGEDGDLRVTDMGVAYYIDYTVSLYQDMLADGVCPEQARMVLPQSMLTEWIWTGSLYAWANVYNKRKPGSEAQRECGVIATQIGEHMSNLYPVSWEALTK